MRIAIDARFVTTTQTEVLPRGGMGRYTYELIRHLVAVDPDVRLTLIVPPKNQRPILGDATDRIREISYRPKPHTLRTFFLLARHLDFTGVDVFHSPFNILPLALTLPTVTTVHDLMWLDTPEIMEPFLPRRWISAAYYRSATGNALKRSTRILTVSEATRNAIVRRYPDRSDQVVVTSNGARIETFLPDVDRETNQISSFVPDGMPFVLCIGQGSPYKNHKRAVEAYIAAFRDHPDMRLVMVRHGIPIERKIRRMIDKAGMSDRVIELPRVSDTDIMRLYRRAMVLIHPSLAEGFGMPPLEAMAAGVPVIISDIPPLVEVAGGAALAVSPDSVAEMAAALVRISKDAALRADLIRLGRDRSRLFEWSKSAKKTLDVYQDALGAGIR